MSPSGDSTARHFLLANRHEESRLRAWTGFVTGF